MRLLSALGDLYRAKPGWETRFPGTHRDVLISFLALAGAMICLYFCADTLYQHNPTSQKGSDLKPLPIMLVLGFQALSFLIIAYGIARLSGKRDRLGSWLVARHWTWLILSTLAAFLFLMVRIGVVSVFQINPVVMGLYLLTFVADFRLAQKIPGLDWGQAIFAACFISLSTIAILLAGVSVFS